MVPLFTLGNKICGVDAGVRGAYISPQKGGYYPVSFKSKKAGPLDGYPI